jgi:hypothetical protein
MFLIQATFAGLFEVMCDAHPEELLGVFVRGLRKGLVTASEERAIVFVRMRS